MVAADARYCKLGWFSFDLHIMIRISMNAVGLVSFTNCLQIVLRNVVKAMAQHGGHRQRDEVWSIRYGNDLCDRRLRICRLAPHG